MRRSKLFMGAVALAAGGSILLLLQWIDAVDRGGPAGLAAPHGPSSGARVEPGSDVAVPDAELVDRVETPAELRAFVRACDQAGPEARARLRELVQRSEDPLVIQHAARALGRIGGSLDPEVLQLLADSRPPVRHAAIRALAGSRDEAALTHLAPLMRDGDGTARSLAIRSVGEVGGARAVALLEALASEEVGEVDRAFIRAALTDARRAEG